MQYTKTAAKVMHDLWPGFVRKLPVRKAFLAFSIRAMTIPTIPELLRCAHRDFSAVESVR
jgi:hypothetical protein